MSKKVATGRRVLAGMAVVAVVGLLGSVGRMAFADASLPDDFSDGKAGDWSKSGGTWSVVSDGGNNVYRQFKVNAEIARAFVGDKGWTDYAVEARVKPTAYGSSAGFVGIAARVSSSTSLYRLVLVSGSQVQLQTLKSGAVTVLSSADLPVATGSWHTLKLEVSGRAVRGSVDGAALVSGTSTLHGQGRVGLVTSRATADFDDVKLVDVGALPTTAPSAAPSPTKNPAAAPTKSSSPTKPPAAAPTSKPESGDGSTAAFPAWPKPTMSQKVTATIKVPTSGLDGEMKRYHGIGDGSQGESQPPMFELADGATLENVIIGAPAGDGVHCRGSCTIRNVWWEDVGEDAATFKGGASATYLVDGGGARAASDKVFQHNGGGTLTIRNFQVENFGKLYRSCGNCRTQFKKTVVIENVKATAPGQVLAGVNANFGDTATFRKVTIVGDNSRKMSICDRFTGNSSGDEPKKIGSGADGVSCRYSSSDITYQ